MSERGLAHLADGVRELDELQGRGEVPREEDHAAHLRVLQPLDVVGRELQPRDVDHHRSESHVVPSLAFEDDEGHRHAARRR